MIPGPSTRSDHVQVFKAPYLLAVIVMIMITLKGKVAPAYN
jgi:hypothetical protein